MTEAMSGDFDPIEAFADIYETRVTLAQQAAEAPEALRDLFEEGVNRAGEQLQELAANPDVVAYYRQIGEQPVRLLAELERAQSMLKSLGLEAQVEAKRAEIESIWSRSPQMRAARSFMSGGLLEGAGVELAPEAAQTEPSDAAAFAPTIPSSVVESQERKKPSITIAIDPRNNITVNGRGFYMGRTAQTATPGKEQEGRAMRTDIMRALAANPDKRFRAGELWEAIRPGTPIDRNQWSLYVREFFENGPTYNRKPIFVAERVKPKLNLYYLGAFDVEIVDTDKLANVNEAVYILPDGREVAGKTAQLLQKMLRANAKDPVKYEDIAGWYEEGELADRRSALSSLVTTVRRVLEGTAMHIQKVRLNERDPESHRAYVGYYITESHEEQAESSGATTPESSSAAGYPEGDKAGEDEAITEPLTLHEATILAGFLNFYSHELQAAGLPVMPAAIFETLNREVIDTYENGGQTSDELRALRERTFDKALALLSDEDKLCAFEDSVECGDPRISLLLELMAYTEDSHSSYVRKLLQSQPNIRVMYDTDPHNGGYRIVGVTPGLADSDGSQL